MLQVGRALGHELTPGTPILDPLFSRNFGGLVLLCIEADFCEQGLIFSIFRDLQDLYSPVGEKKTTEFVSPKKNLLARAKQFMFKVGAKIDF